MTVQDLNPVVSTLLSGQGHGLGQFQYAVQQGLIDTGQDSVNPAGMKQGLAVYCGYKAGAPGYRRGGFSNMPAIKARFPGKKYLCVGTDCIDIETGLASAADGPGFVRGWTKDNTNKPVLYANMSTMPSVKSALNSAGIARSSYYLWVAIWNGGPIPSGYDAIQNGSTQGYDSDLFEDYMWGGTGPTPPPGPGPVPPPVPTPVPPPTGNIAIENRGITRTTRLKWTPPVGVTVDHYVIICSPVSPSGIIRPPGSLQEVTLKIPAQGPVTVNIYAVATTGHVAGHGSISFQ